jgi:hypothetical protein
MLLSRGMEDSSLYREMARNNHQAGRQTTTANETMMQKSIDLPQISIDHSWPYNSIQPIGDGFD